MIIKKGYLFLFVSILIQPLNFLILKYSTKFNYNDELLFLFILFCIWCLLVVFRVVFWMKVLTLLELSLAYSFCSLVPVFIMIMGVIFFNEKITKGNVLGGIMISTGLIIMAQSKKSIPSKKCQLH